MQEELNPGAAIPPSGRLEPTPGRPSPRPGRAGPTLFRSRPPIPGRPAGPSRWRWDCSISPAFRLKMFRDAAALSS